FFFSSRRRHTRFDCDWSSDVCSSDLAYKENARRTGRFAKLMVGARGFEPPTPRSRTECSTRLSHAPTKREPRLYHRFNGFKVQEIGRASCRERVYIEEGGRAVKRKKK